MKSVTLSFNERLYFGLILGVQYGTVAENMMLARMIRILDPTPEEAKAANVRHPQPGVVTWDQAVAIPDRKLKFEDCEAAKALSVLRTWDKFSVSDLPVQQRLIAAFGGGAA